MTEKQMLRMLKLVRSLAWIGYADGRSEEDCRQALYEILVTTREVGND